MPFSDSQRKINKLIADAVIEAGKKVFKQSQVNVPYKTGKLFNTGMYKPLSLGFEIWYGEGTKPALYARDIEYGRNQPNDDGLNPPPPEATYRAYTYSHKRRTKKGISSVVKGHFKTYTAYKRPSFVEGVGWRTFDMSQSTQGKHYVGEALEMVFGDIFNKSNGLQQLLKTTKIQAKD